MATATEATAIPAFAPGERDEEGEDGLGVVVGVDSAIVVGVGMDVELVLGLVTATVAAKLMPVLLSQQAVLLLPQQNMTASFGEGVTSTSSTLSFPS
jgi:hypothetical protein